jgi:hypothetical protein
MRILIFSFAALILMSGIAYADVLRPGEASFEILGIILNVSNPGDDFTGTAQNLALYGDISYLNIKWIAHYADYIDRKIAIDCYLNCPNPGTDIVTNCAAYKNSTNYCNYTALTGYGFCTIVNPNYIFNKTLNNVTCRFYDPGRTDIKYLPYPNRTFYSTTFDIFEVSGESVTVGQPIDLGLSIRNRGLLVTTFTSRISPMNKPDLVIIENPVGQTGQLKYNQVGKLNPAITLLSAEEINFKVLTRSDIDPFTCIYNESCASGELCIDNKCWTENVITINANKSSLPDFGLVGILQIMALSAAVILLINSRANASK